MTLRRRAFYFPVRETPYRMEAGLHRFGTDFGNGPADSAFFQRDDEAARYEAEKARTAPRGPRMLSRDERDRAAHRAVARWLRDTAGSELALPAFPEDDEPDAFYASLAGAVQEDFVILRRDGEGEAAIAVFVSFPSGWRPERILGRGFASIHGPVPGFADEPAQARAMVASMVERGPYVRFVWTLSPDGHLDHHPDARREPWRGDSRGWLRVERQVTVPFPAEETSLFLIRIYLYPFDELTPAQRETLARAVRAMPEEVACYKRLDGPTRELVLGALSRSGPAAKDPAPEG